jgi:hypothetical protein
LGHPVYIYIYIIWKLKVELGRLKLVKNLFKNVKISFLFPEVEVGIFSAERLWVVGWWE